MIQRWMMACVLLVSTASAWAVSPYIQGDSVSGGTVQAVASAVEAKLKSHGFKVVGKYFPKGLAGHGVVIATDEAMLDEVGSVGGSAILGATTRVGVKADGSVAYTNPDYWYRAYFRKAFDKKEGAVKALQTRLQEALGAGANQGGDEPPGSLINYRYMVGMERLDSPKNKLAEHGSFAEALKMVRDNLAKSVGKTARIYEVVMADRKLAVFGVALNDSESGDGVWVKKIGMQDNIAGLPYEIYINNKTVESPHGRFRIALAFPDVGMGQFMRISDQPDFIMETMNGLAGEDKKAEGEN